MEYRITCMPQNQKLTARAGQTVLEVLRTAGLQPDAPCGGKGTCGKCRVTVDGKEVLSCQTIVDRDMVVELRSRGGNEILTGGISEAVQPDGKNEYVLAYDIGTTTVVCYLLSGITGKLLAQASTLNPQVAFGGDVISRIQYVMETGSTELRDAIRGALGKLAREAARKAGITPEQITLASVVGNTAMHHLLLGIDPTSMTVPPYMPAVSDAMVIPSAELLPIHPEGTVRILPNIAGFVGADTVGCLEATRFDRLEELTLMIDIGTNGEMVLGNKDRRIACSTAAGPAFEGAKIQFGMRGANGAIDHVRLEKGLPVCSVIGGGRAEGICGSGLLDAAKVLLDGGMISEMGRMEPEDVPEANWTVYDNQPALILKDQVLLTQKDVREIQLAKAAIRAGIELMARRLGVQVEDIRTVYLAGAFGCFLSPESACGIGMIPPCLLDKIRPIGNAAGEGAKMCALSEAEFENSKKLAKGCEFLELASMPEFQDYYVDCLTFGEEEED